MKKYVKPELFYEQFEMARHIANCGWELHVANACVAKPDVNEWGDYTQLLFASEGQGCTVTNVQDYCYQNGSDNTPGAYIVTYS